MLKYRRICIPITLSCNLQCKYCYRNFETISEVPEFTPDMIQYLRTLDPSWCEAVVISGGEPLLHWDKILEIFTYVPNDIHKVILTNGTLLTQDKVDYFNKNNIEISLSHDGPQTEFLRGIDIFKNQTLLSLIRQINFLNIYSVITTFNTDVWENFFHIATALNRIDFFYNSIPIGDNNVPDKQYLIKDFDYDLFLKTYTEFQCSHYNIKNPYRNGELLTDDPAKNKRFGGFNILPNGIVCGMVHINSNYGTIYTNTYDELMQKVDEFGQLDHCHACEYENNCKNTIQYLSKHVCKWRKLKIDFYKNKEKTNNLYNNIENMLPDIKAKYGYIGE